MDSERRFLQHLIDAHVNENSSVGQTKLRRRKKRVVASLSADDQIKESILEGMLFRHLSQQFSKLQSQVEGLDSKFPQQLVKRISQECRREYSSSEKDPDISLKKYVMALPKIAKNLLLNSPSKLGIPTTAYSPFFLECWKGRKRVNEDYVSVHQSKENSIYAVFDGHGGTSAAEFTSSVLVPEMSKCSGHELSEDKILEIFDRIQEDLERSVSDRSGTTAAVFIQNSETYTFAWVGDSAILGIDEVSEEEEEETEEETVEEAELLSNPHTLECSLMRENIVKSGAVITGSKGNYRVNGELGVARALGRSGPRPAISAKPSLFQYSSSSVKQRFKWICLVTDGVTDVLSLEKIGSCIRAKAESPAIAVLETSLHAGATDNLSCIVVDVRED